MSSPSETDVGAHRDASVGGQLMRASLERSLFGGEATQVRLGRFVVIDRLGSGAMGIVYRAFDPELGRTVAVKVLASGREHLGERMRREAQTLARLNHPHIVTIHEAGKQDDRMYVAMELVAGGTLRDWCERNPPGSRRRFERVLDLAIQAARGLAAAHAAGLVHRDLKPANMLVDHHERLRIADFGLARVEATLVDEAPSRDESAPATGGGSDAGGSLTGTGDVLGTPAYMAPEQFSGRCDARSDQWSLCATFWEAAFGVRAYTDDTAPSLVARQAPPDPPPRRPEVPEWFRAVLLRGLSPVPADRFADVDALLAEIERRRGRRQKLARWLGAAAIVGSLAWGVWPSREDSPCVAADRGLDAVWNDEVAGSVRSTGSTSVEIQEHLERLVGRLDGFAARWRAGAREVCERARARGELATADVLELPSRSMACFRDARAQMEAILEAILAADSTSNAVLLGHVLPPLSRCEDAGAGPADDEGRGGDAAVLLAKAAVAVTRREVDTARALLAEARPVLEDVDRPGLWQRYHQLEASIAGLFEDFETHFPAARRGLAAAELAGDPVDIAFAWTFVIEGAAGLGRFEQADFFVERALSMTHAAGDPGWLVANIAGTRSRMEHRRGNHELAYELGREYVDWLEAHGESDLRYAKYALDLMQIAIRAGEPEAAAEVGTRAAAGFASALGERHVQTARAYAALALMLNSVGDAARAEPLARIAASVLETSTVVHADDRIVALATHVEVLRTLGRFDEARVAAATALKRAAEVLGEDEIMFLVARSSAASIDLEDGHYDAAITQYEDILPRLDRNTQDTSEENRVINCLNLALAHARADHRDRARELATACRARLESLSSDPAALRGGALRSLGEIHHRGGRFDEARAAYREAIAQIDRLPVQGTEHTESHLGLAEVLADDGELAEARRELELAERASTIVPPLLRKRLDALRERIGARGD